jgi:hypothetical protein
MPSLHRTTAKSQNACRRLNTGTSAVLQDISSNKIDRMKLKVFAPKTKRVKERHATQEKSKQAAFRAA